MANYHQLKAYVKHWLTVVDQHSIHSPFFFDFYKKVIQKKKETTDFAEIEKLRAHLLLNQTELSVEDLGAGSQVWGTSKRKLADIAKNDMCQVTTFEGSHALADVALTNFEYFDKKNIELVEGNIHSTLPEFVQHPAKIDFVLMDANHRYEATMHYFDLMMRRLDEKSIVVIDDIHWSEEMERAWNELRNSQLIYGSVDLFRCGILFFDPALNRQHFIWSL